MAISVLRGGETAYAWSGEGWAVRLDHADHAMLIKFKIFYDTRHVASRVPARAVADLDQRPAVRSPLRKNCKARDSGAAPRFGLSRLARNVAASIVC
jgi:hypothetical protein